MVQLGAAASGQPLPTTESGGEVSLVRGGPFYRAQEAARLIESDRWNHGRRVIFAIAIGWLPLVLITLLFNPRAVLGLLTDYTVNARMLIGVPVVIAGQAVMETSFRSILRHIRNAALLTPSDTARLDETLVRLIRLRDSFIPELLIAVAVYAHVVELVQTHLALARPWVVAGTGTEAHLSPAGWYYVLISQFLFQFLMGVSLWKWLLWWIFLFRLSRLNLQLMPTHPDQHGGIGFLGVSPMALAPTIFAGSAVIGATWRAEILRSGGTVHLMSFKLDGIVLLGIVLILALGPLLFFVPKLASLRRRGIFEYGTLAQLESTAFHDRWILHRAGREEEFPASPEASTLTDYGSSYQNIEHLQPFPYDRGILVVLVLAIAIPMLPMVLAEIPFAEVLKGLLSAVR
jgi:hypothetical protein